MRIYTLEGTKVKFEIKRKSFGRQLKETIKINKNNAIEIMNGNYVVLLNYTTCISEYSYNLIKTHNYRPVH